MNQFDQLGKNIRSCREAAGLTQSELADRLFVSFQAVSAWERGQSIPDLENALRLSRLFDVSVDSLIRGGDREVFVGIDGGGTKTEFVSFLADGTVLGRVVTERSNPNDVGGEACLNTLTAGISGLMQGMVPKAVFAGIACRRGRLENRAFQITFRKIGDDRMGRYRCRLCPEPCSRSPSLRDGDLGNGKLCVRPSGRSIVPFGRLGTAF